MTADLVELPSLLRYARHDERLVGHILPSSWPEPARPRSGRPSLCGVWSGKWRNRDHLPRPADVVDCPDCNRLAGITVRPPTPLDTAPVAGHRTVGLHIVPTAVATALDPQGAHARIGPTHRIRRGPWLASIPGASTAHLTETYH